MLDELFRRNAEWAQAQIDSDPMFFKRLVALQTPEYLWIGCSDSRVPANEITGLAPGEVFVHRNVANLVHPTDLNLLSVLQYAVEFLKVQHIMVVGHYGCGGVIAACDSIKRGLIDHWLRPIQDLAAKNKGELNAIEDEKDRVNRLCELNVLEQVRHIGESPIVRQAWEAGQPLELHGWIYSLEDGRLRDLQCSRDANGPIAPDGPAPETWLTIPPHTLHDH